MKVELYNYAVRSKLSRRRLLQGATALGGLAAMSGFSALPARAQGGWGPRPLACGFEMGISCGNSRQS